MEKIIKKVLKKIECDNYKAYIVGGYVRDKLLNKKTLDIDICTNAKIEYLENIFKGRKTRFNSIIFKIKKYNFCITTFRKEKNYINRKPKEIICIDNLEEDLLRRDFRINTICLDKNNHLIDLLGGINDIKNKKITLVGNSIKLKEDPLRILRAIRFATVLDFDLDNDLKESIIKYKNCIKELSLYRIKSELSLILKSKNYQKGLKLLEELELNKILNLEFKNIIYTNNLLGMWAQIDEFSKFPFTKIEKNNIVKIREILDYGKIDKKVLYNYGLDLSLTSADILKINPKKVKEIYKSMKIKKRSDLKISFKEIKENLDINNDEIQHYEKVLIDLILDNKLENNKKKIILYLDSCK